MRLDISSMDKLWDLMIMVFKWQVAMATSNDEPQSILDLTFRHMDGIGRLIPEMKKTLLIDCTKRHLIEYWDSMSVNDRDMIVNNMKKWVDPFHVKISILIRLGFQRMDGSFELNAKSDFFYYYLDHIGENIYSKHAYMASVKTVSEEPSSSSMKKATETHEIDTLVSQLNITHTACSESDEQSKNDGILDEVSFNFGKAAGSNNFDSLNRSEFFHITTVSTLKKILEKFSYESGATSSSEEHQQTPHVFDATEQLLRMLDEN